MKGRETANDWLQPCEILMARRASDYRWRLLLAPEPAPLYEAAIEEMIRRAREIEGMIGAYDLGPVRYPGLSDVDLLFVVEDDFRDFGKLGALRRGALPVELWPVVTHDPYFIRRRELGEIFQFAPIFELNARWRGDETLPTGGRIEDGLDLLLFLVDIIIDGYPREFIAYLSEPMLDEHELVGRLKGLAYCFDLYRRVTGASEGEFEAYSNEIRELREKFFVIPSGPRAERVFALAQRAIALSWLLARLTAEHLREAWGARPRGRVGVARPRIAAIHASPAPELPRFAIVPLRRKAFVTTMPLEYAPVLSAYAAAEGPVGAWLRGGFVGRLSEGEELPAGALAEAAARRTRLRNAHQAWLNRMGLGLPGFLTFGYRTRVSRGPLRSARAAAGRSLDRLYESRLRRFIQGVARAEA